MLCRVQRVRHEKPGHLISRKFPTADGRHSFTDGGGGGGGLVRAVAAVASGR